jgi:hypothetical protein
MPVSVAPSDDFRKIALSVTTTGVRTRMTRPEFLSYFGVTRVGVRIKSQISYHLRRMQVTTEPDFRGKAAHEFYLIKATPRSQLKQLKPEEPEVDEIDDNGGTIGELEIANRLPEFVLRDTSSEVLFQRLVQSGPRGIVMVVKRIESIKADPTKGVLAHYVAREPQGVVTWEAYARFLKQNKAEPTVAEVMTRDISIVHQGDDVVMNMLRIEKLGVLAVVGSDGCVTGLLTRRDLLCELADSLVPYYIIALIEEFLRMRIKAAAIPLVRLREVAVDDRLQSEDDLEFKGYENIFGNPELFSRMNMSGTAGEMQKLLENVREHRNDLMHFNQEEDRDYAMVLRSAYDSLRKLAKQ